MICIFPTALHTHGKIFRVVWESLSNFQDRNGSSVSVCCQCEPRGFRNTLSSKARAYSWSWLRPLLTGFFLFGVLPAEVSRSEKEKVFHPINTLIVCSIQIAIMMMPLLFRESCWLLTLLLSWQAAFAADDKKTGPPPFFLQDANDSLCLAGEEFKRCSIDTLFYVVGSPGKYILLVVLIVVIVVLEVVVKNASFKIRMQRTV